MKIASYWAILVIAVLAFSACPGPGPDKDSGTKPKKDSKPVPVKDAGQPPAEDEGVQDSAQPVVDALPPDAPICPKTDACLWKCGNAIMEPNEQCDKFDFGGKTCKDFGYKGGSLKCDKYCKLSTWWCIPHGCGNGSIGNKEQCDGKNLNGKTCKSLGYQGGELNCYSNCKWDVAGCQSCGDKLITGKEQCEPGQKINKTCKELGFKGGTVTCNPKSCMFNTWWCIPYGCGNNVLNAGEQCDGTQLGTKTCKSFGYDYGDLKCNKYCHYDVSGCKHCKCGDGWVGGWEDCDGKDLDGKTCFDLGYDSGTLACQSNCAFDTTGCNKCGDGKQNGTEDCEGTDLAGKTCQTQGFHSGTLACDPFCKFDTSACTNCGNGKVQGTEQCDGADLNKKNCLKLGYHYGKVSCNSDCTFNTSQCKKFGCGDGIVSLLEQCDGTNLNGKTCAKLGFHSGTLGCKTNCKYDTSKCTNCGNSKVNSGEQCDGTNLGGASCKTVGYTDGTLTCNANCTLNKAGCYKCGDWKINNVAEQCDGPSLAGKTCKSFGFYTGALKCDSKCKYSTAKCHNCGNAKMEGTEQCDGKDFGTKTCQTMGYWKGTLSCSNCKLYAYGCTNCGNGILDGAEQCDGANLGLSTCKSLGYHSGSLNCYSNCKFNKTGCTNCGNGKVEYGEQCDGAALAGKTCKSYGFDGGTLSCAAGCKVVTSGCWKTKTVGDTTFAQFNKGAGTDSGVKLFIAADGNVQLLDRLDLNGDGYLDLAFGNRYNGVSSNINSYIYWGSKTGFSKLKRTGLPTVGGVGTTAADLNGDGHLDLVFSNYDNAKKQGNSLVLHQHKVNSYVYWGSGSGYGPTNKTELPTVGAAGNAVADLNGDGYLDIVFANVFDGSSTKVNAYVYWGAQSGYSTAKRTELPVLGAPKYPGPRVAIADLNGDGYPDLVFANWSDGTSVKVDSYIYWGSAKGYSVASRTGLPTMAAAGVSVADLNGDGNLDIVFSNHTDGSSNKVDSYIYWGSAAGYSVAKRSGLPTVGATGNSVADVDGDGNLDIVFSNHADGKNKKQMSYVYFGAKTGFTTANRKQLPTIGAGDNLVADLNGDGYPDVVFANQDDDKTWQLSSYVYWGSASGLSVAKRSELLTVGATGVLAGGDPGSCHKRGALQQFVSRALDTGLASPVFLKLALNVKVPANTKLTVQVRSAATVAGLKAATWYGPTSAGGSYTAASTALNAVHQGHRYVQYRARLSSDFGNTPLLDAVTFSFHQ